LGEPNACQKLYNLSLLLSFIGVKKDKFKDACEILGKLITLAVRQAGAQTAILKGGKSDEDRGRLHILVRSLDYRQPTLRKLILNRLGNWKACKEQS
jgi:hypothetical protein